MYSEMPGARERMCHHRHAHSSCAMSTRGRYYQRALCVCDEEATSKCMAFDNVFLGRGASAESRGINHQEKVGLTCFIFS